MKEIYKEYPLDKRYKVSNMGNIKGINGELLKPYIDKSGRKRVSISLIDVYVHQAVAETFLNHKRCGHKVVVDHIDNNPSNNTLGNLQLISHRENLLKDKKNKTSKLRGVSIDSCSNSLKYRSQVMLGRKMYYLGLFNSQHEANIAYLDALNEYDKFINE